MPAQDALGMADIACALAMSPFPVSTWCGKAAPKVARATGGRQVSAAAKSQAIVLITGKPR
jgi:hypothetical protein